MVSAHPYLKPENLPYFLKHVAEIINSVSKFMMIHLPWIKQANGIDENCLITTVAKRLNAYGGNVHSMATLKSTFCII